MFGKDETSSMTSEGVLKSHFSPVPIPYKCVKVYVEPSSVLYSTDAIYSNEWLKMVLFFFSKVLRGFWFLGVLGLFSLLLNCDMPLVTAAYSKF